MRNNAFSGPLNNAINNLGEGRDFHQVLGVENRDNWRIYKEMRDSELVVRFFTFKDTWSSFKGGIRRSMDAFMEAHRHMNDVDIAVYREAFLGTLKKVTTVFRDHAFHRWMPEKRSWRRQVLASLYDAQLFALPEFSAGGGQRQSGRDYAEICGAVCRCRVQQAIDAATNTPQYFKARIMRMVRLLNDV